MTPRRSFWLFALLTLLIASAEVRYFSEQPMFADAFYHYNVAARLVKGEGFTDDYLWTYMGAPATLPAPSNVYWMPGTSLIAAAGMVIFGVSYAAAQVGLVVCLWGAVLLTYWLGKTYGGALRHAWTAGLIVLFGGFFMRFWGTTDTFAPYLLVGSAALVCIGKGAETGKACWWIAAGLCAAGGHLVRSDGLLLLFVGWAVVLLQIGARHASPLRKNFVHLGIFTLAYVLGMSAWFARNLNAIGTILPTGGTQALWYTQYDDLFNYPPVATAQTFFADGIGLLLESRWSAFRENLGTLVAVQGLIVLVPFILIALFKRGKQPFWWGVGLFALGIFAAFTLIFPFPGIRGGLFHASAALMPFWAVLGSLGIEDTFDWIARRRRHWRGTMGKPIFAAGVVLVVLWLSLTVSANRRVGVYTLPHYEALKAMVPPTTRVMINDPAQLYYQTGLGGVVLPNAAPEQIPVIAAQYEVDYLLVELFGDTVAMPKKLLFDLDHPPPFLVEVPTSEYAISGTRLYRIVR